MVTLVTQSLVVSKKIIIFLYFFSLRWRCRYGAGRPLTRSAGVVGSEDSCTDSAIGSASTGDRSTSTSAITKSNSTPASLQAVVRLSACGSNMSLHHKVVVVSVQTLPYGYAFVARGHVVV